MTRLLSPQPLSPYRLALRSPLTLIAGQNSGREPVTLTAREGAIITLPLSDGIRLYGDLCPLPNIHQESLGEAKQQWQEQVYPLLAAGDITLSTAQFAMTKPGFGLLSASLPWEDLFPSVRFGLESALLPWWLKHQPAMIADPIVPAADFAQVFYARGSTNWLASAKRAYADHPGSKAAPRIFKIKIGGTDWPKQRQAIAELLTSCPHLRLRLDANHQLSAEDYDHPELRNWPIEFIEDALPVSSPQAGEHIAGESRRTIPFAKAVDDSLWDIPPAESALTDATVLVLKPARLAGLSGAWQWLELAHKTQRQVVLSSCYESGIGLKAQLIWQRLATSLFGRQTICTPGLSPYLALSEDVYNPRLNLNADTNLAALPNQPPEAEAPSCAIAAHRWWQALYRRGDCMVPADPRGAQVSYKQLREQVEYYVQVLRGQQATWKISDGDALAVWTAALACLITGQRLLTVYRNTPKNQMAEWDSLCREATGEGLRPWPPSPRRLEGRGEGRQNIKDGEILVATSGSMGERKLARLSASALYYSALGTTAYYGIDSADRWGLCLPLFHVGGLMILLRSTLAGAAVVPLSASGKKGAFPSPRKTGVSVISIVPTQLSDILSPEAPTPPADWSALKAIIVGGAATSPELAEEAFEHKLPVSLTYGMTESCSQLLATKPGSAAPKEALPFREVTIQDGRIAFTGLVAFSGYLGKAPPGDWVISQDQGELKPDGSIAILGRADRQIIKGGETIPLATAENAAAALGLMSCAVPLEHPRFGQSYALVVASSQKPDDEALADALAGAMPKFWQPENVIWLKSDGLTGIKLSAAEARQAVASWQAHQPDGRTPP